MKDQIQREYMMVNPQEIVIDMPCSFSNVEAKKSSIQQVGIIQPITVWIEGLRIIDGFHRVKAAQELGLAEVPSMVIDCSEEAFWDARIQSAKQHHEIEDSRLVQWIFECWKASDFVTEPTYAAFAFFVYDRRLDRKNDSKRDAAASAWLDEKAERWGVKRWKNVAQDILTLSKMYKLPKGLAGDGLYDPRDFDGGLSPDELVVISMAFPKQNATPEQAVAYLKEVGKPSELAGSTWLGKRRRSENDIESDRQREIFRRNQERERQFLETEQGKAIHRKRRMDAIADDIERILRSLADYSIDEWNESFTLAEGIAEDKRLKAQVDLLAAACVEFWRLAGKPLTSEMLALENQELRNENQRLLFRLNEYERKATAAQDRKNKRAAVLSSTDIEYMPEA